MDNKEPLVSIVVITYNSSETVIETLESIKSQTYQNIEVVITDDMSQDDTVEKCKKWFLLNESHLTGYKIIVPEMNTGTAGNVNRGVYNASGIWIKIIAGDDMLFPTAIEDCVHYVMNFEDPYFFCVGDVEPFSSSREDIEGLKKVYDYYFKCEHKSYEEQHEQILRVGTFVGPGFFFSRKLYCDVGGCLEQYPFCEEWSLCYNIIKAGVRILPIDKKLVRYRVADTSVSHSEGKGLESWRCFISRYNFFFDYPFKELIKEKKYLVAWDGYLDFKTLMFCHKKGNSFFSRLLRKIVMLLSPYMYYRKMEMKSVLKNI